jgi:hypothetical protein
MATIIQALQNVLNNLDDQLFMDVKRIHIKEALQSLVLDYIYNHPLYRSLNFYGGTCLHIIYNLNRLSEDIDLLKIGVLGPQGCVMGTGGCKDQAACHGKF